MIAFWAMGCDLLIEAVASAHISKITANRLNVSTVAFRVTIVKEVLVARMERLEPLRVLDRTPMLFGSSSNFGDIRTNPVCVGTVNAVQSF
jgi:hypothetical protein